MLKQSCLAAIVALAAFHVALAAEPATRPTATKGYVVKLDGPTLVLKVFPKDKVGEEMRVTTNDQTTVTVDGKAAKLQDLTAGLWAKVAMTDGAASKVTAFTPKPKQPAGEKGEGEKADKN